LPSCLAVLLQILTAGSYRPRILETFGDYRAKYLNSGVQTARFLLHYLTRHKTRQKNNLRSWQMACQRPSEHLTDF
jgi:hypothetical protein